MKRWPFRFHDLRHFSVSTLIAAGVDVRTVADRHGHARAWDGVAPGQWETRCVRMFSLRKIKNICV